MIADTVDRAAHREEEARRTATLEWIPRPMRTRMDSAGVRISLAQWQALAMDDRRALARAATDAGMADADYAARLLLAVARSAT